MTPDNQDEGEALGAALRASALSPLRSDRTRKRFRPIRVTISAQSSREIRNAELAAFLLGAPCRRHPDRGGEPPRVGLL